MRIYRSIVFVHILFDAECIRKVRKVSKVDLGGLKHPHPKLYYDHAIVEATVQVKLHLM